MIRSDRSIPLTIPANSEFALELAVTPVMKGSFGQQFHFYLDVGNVLVTKEVEFEGQCMADAPHVKMGVVTGTLPSP